jgi:pimeloyl-ACP methyl ester carboxylesterase
MAEMKHRTIETNGIRVHCVEHGTGPLVVLCHGFPESWYSWRHQLHALGEAGFHAVAPDMRGYGQTDRPAGIDQYTLLHLTGDMVGLLDAFDADTAVIAGHDWGAPVAWLAALLRPDRFRGVIGLSVPYRPRGEVRPTTVMPQTEHAVFYQCTFRPRGLLKPSSRGIYVRPFALPSIGVPGMRCAIWTAAWPGFASWSRAMAGGSRTGQSQLRCRPGSARPTWTFMSGSSRAPDLPAVSIGIGTSTATGSS